MKASAAVYPAQPSLHWEPAAARSNFWLRAVSPSLATLAAVTALFCTLFLFHGYRELFRDSDTGRHIQAGEEILLSGHVPLVDSVSFSKPGAPFFNWEWLADVLMAETNRAAGLAGIALLYAVSFAVCVWLWVRLTWQARGTVLLAALLLVPMLPGIDLHLLARPHVLSWILLIAAVTYFERLQSPFGAKQALQVFALSLIWTNLHASFFLLILIGAIYTASAFCARHIWLDASPLPARIPAQATLIAASATLLNPYSWHLYQHLLAFLRDRTLFDTISEYRSFDFHLPGSGFVIFALAFSATGAILALTQRKLPAFLLCFIFFSAALRTVRMIPLLALVCLPLAAGSVTEAIRSAAGLQPGVRRFRDRLLEFGDQVQHIDRNANGWLLAAFALVLAVLFLRLPSISAQTGFSPKALPVEAAEAVAQLPASARLFTTDFYGSYLIYRFKGERKVFFDGRGDFYGDAFFNRYERIVSLDPGWEHTWNRWHFTHALLPNRSKLLDALEKLHWRSIYHDSHDTLLAAPEKSQSQMRVIER